MTAKQQQQPEQQVPAIPGPPPDEPLLPPDPPSDPPIVALEPSTEPVHPLRATDVAALLPKDFG